jgi:phage tail tape-measure protein
MEKDRRTTMKGKSSVIGIALVLSLGASSGCSTPLTTREEGAGIGLLGGAAAGGLIGAAVGHAGVGAGVGSLLGLGAGALIGDQLQGREMQEKDQQRQLDEQQQEILRQQNEINRLKSGEY